MAKNTIGMAIACEEYGAKFFANGAAPSGVLEHPGTIKDPSRVRESWQSTFGGSANVNKVFLLRCVQLGISVRDLDLLTIGMVNDMYVESGNDQDADKNYSVLATQADFDRF